MADLLSLDCSDNAWVVLQTEQAVMQSGREEILLQMMRNGFIILGRNGEKQIRKS